MKVKKFPKILFFIKGSIPTKEDYEAAESLGPNCVFRNASFVPSTGSLEKCNGVAGLVPELYKSEPSAEEALGQMKLSFEKKAAPKKPKAEPKKAKVEGDTWKPNA